MSEPNYNCGRGKVMETDEWLATHAAHGDITREPFKRQPPTYKLFHLICPCGAKHVVMEQNREVKPPDKVPF